MRYAPVVPKLPKGAIGTRGRHRKDGAVPIDAETAARIIAALPEFSPQDGFPIRARFALQWETSLRQATIGRLSVPEHYRKGAAVLKITSAIDKAKFGRELPLTAAARAALDSVCPNEGLVFKWHPDRVYRRYLASAAKAAGLPLDQARDFSAYDLRHGRITDLLGRGAPLTAVAFIAGHTLITTTNTYAAIATAGKAAADALALDGMGTGRIRDGKRKKRQ